jgi:phosphatidylserine decarboxylase
MKHSGKARQAAFRLLFFTFIAAIVLGGIAVLGTVAAAVLTTIILPVFLVGWVLFVVFTLYFFRDPNPRVPAGPGLILSPAHGTVDVIDTTTEPQFMGGEVQRISIFLSVFNVHVQNAPVSGKVAFYKYTLGEFLNALKTESAAHNENVLLGFESTDPRDAKIGVRLIAGAIARRIVPFVSLGDQVVRGERISLIQFGSRADVYLPAGAKIKVKLGDKVVGGETVLATYE